MKNYKSVAQVAMQVMNEIKYEHVGISEFNLLDEIADRIKKLGNSKYMDMHSLNRHIAIVNLLEGSKYFDKYYILRIDSMGIAERPLRLFELKKEFRTF